MFESFFYALKCEACLEKRMAVGELREIQNEQARILRMIRQALNSKMGPDGSSNLDLIYVKCFNLIFSMIALLQIVPFNN